MLENGPYPTQLIKRDCDQNASIVKSEFHGRNTDPFHLHLGRYFQFHRSELSFINRAYIRLVRRSLMSIHEI